MNSFKLNSLLIDQFELITAHFSNRDDDSD